MQTGSVLTLNFYSNPIDVMIGDDQTIYINKDHFMDMLEVSPEIAPHNIVRGEFDASYLALSYINSHMDQLVAGSPLTFFKVLTANEFTNYIIRELGVVRELLPMIELEYDVYNSGIFEHDGQMYVLKNQLHKFTGIHKPILPQDVPCFPIMVCVKTLKPRNPLGALLAAKASLEVNHILPTWMIEVSSLPYIVAESAAPKVMTNGYINLEALGPKQRFDSPGVVGTHSCELDPDQKERDDNWRKALLQDLDEPMTWAGSGLTLKSEL